MSWEFLVETGLKTFVTAGITLILLQIVRGRSAAERSLVAHAGLGATLLLPLIALTVPQWRVEAPAAIAWPAAAAMPAPVALAPIPTSAGPATLPPVPSGWAADGIVPLLLYAVPALALGLLTLLAVGRLFAIRRRASVLTEQRWLSALAHAQRRMGFKNGAALLTSPELGSPVSWGLIRPTIVINESAAASDADAEAIIAHELAHVLRWDWLKLLAARIATALYWFNPLVWLLARQCHQLREEAADDAVLRSEVRGVDYAQLLVGAARHESRGMMLAANGVAPARDSLKRRVARVLDAGLSRTPGGIGWRAGCAAGALLLSAPLAAITPVPAGEAVEALVPSPVAVSPAPQIRVTEVAPEDPNLGVEAAPMAAEEAVAEAEIAVEAQAHAVLSQEFALARFHEVEVKHGGQVVLRPGAAFSIRSRAGWIDPARFRVSGGRLVVEPCTMDCAAGPVEIVLPRINAVAVEGGGSIVAGPGFPRARSIAAAVQSGGTIDLRAVPVDDAIAAVNSGGQILIRPARSLTGAVDGGGEIVYWGDPAVMPATSRGGVIRRGGGT